MHVVFVVVHVPEGLPVTVYETIVSLGSMIGAVQETVTCVEAGRAFTEVGDGGVVPGIEMLDGSDSTPVPASFVAATVNEYCVPLVRPFTVQDVVAVVHVNPDGFAVAR